MKRKSIIFDIPSLQGYVGTRTPAPSSRSIQAKHEITWTQTCQELLVCCDADSLRGECDLVAQATS